MFVLKIILKKILNYMIRWERDALIIIVWANIWTWLFVSGPVNKIDLFSLENQKIVYTQMIDNSIFWVHNLTQKKELVYKRLVMIF